jgi:uncharacterized protein with HEPN domain
MRDDAAHLLDMFLAAQKILKFIDGISEEAFRASELHQSAVIRELQVIGEAARLVSEKSKTQYEAINWTIIIGMRNRLVHEYFRINLRIVWDTISNHIPILIAQLQPLIPPPEE